ncbi:hypothetical protein Tcan_12313 [Toxocara canis]|uniref:Uncharacterized protein n=1 Tax=Toxocara canis TaxID=6265 RepID=A0A0B2VGL5_TOXCA|nr:hypothetical protein Tcan_12313 [Toxocara canis]
MALQWQWIVFFAVVIPSARGAVLLGSQLPSASGGDQYTQKNVESIPEENSSFMQQLIGFTTVARGAQLLRELQSEQQSSNNLSRLSRTCYFSPVQCLLMKKENGMIELLKMGHIYDIMTGKKSPQLYAESGNENFGRPWAVSQRYRPLMNSLRLYDHYQPIIKKWSTVL